MRIARAAVLAAAALALFAATPLQLDSEYVLQRYTLAIDAAPIPKTVIFTYVVSQAGPTNVEQRHVLYRSGADVRDETLSVDGVALPRKIVRFSHRDDPYALSRLAPRPLAYQLLFLRTVKDVHHLDYLYEATPLLHPGAGATVNRVSIDGLKFLPRVVYFTSKGPQATGTGRVEYAAFGKYWMPVLAEVNAQVDGKPARERISWGDYRFPESLPASTFVPPKPLPHATLPPI